jgi:membrane dipeptidase
VTAKSRFLGQHEVAPPDRARASYDEAVRQGIWQADTYPPPPYHYPDGISTPWR